MSSDTTASAVPSARRPRRGTVGDVDGVWKVIADLEHEDVELTWHHGPTPIVAINSEKGGVGKTGLTGGLAAVAGDAGLRTLVIDMDPRATASKELGAPVDEAGYVVPPFSVNDILYVDPSDLDPTDPTGTAADAIMAADPSWPASVRLLAAERVLANREPDPAPGWENRLRLSLIGVADDYDLILMDLPPRAGGKLVAAALIAATHALIPATLDADGYDGADHALKTIKRLRVSNGLPPLPIIGIVRNIVEPRTNDGETWAAKIEQQWPDVVLTDVGIPKRVLRKESRTAGVPFTAGSGKDKTLLVRAYTRVLNHIGKAG